MTLLKLKVIVYRCFGIYLAQREEYLYLTSNEFWIDFTEHSEGYRDYRERQEMLLALWQADNGFTRPLTKYTFKEPRIVYTPLNWIAVLLKELGL